MYATERCIEEMYKNEPFGLYKYGYVEDLKKIDAQSLYKYYKEMISTCKIDIFVSGDVDEKIVKILEENESIKNLKERETKIKEIVKNNKERFSQKNIEIKKEKDNLVIEKVNKE